jgi:hypothetical protein
MTKKDELSLQRTIAGSKHQHGEGWIMVPGMIESSDHTKKFDTRILKTESVSLL